MNEVKRRGQRGNSRDKFNVGNTWPTARAPPVEHAHADSLAQNPFLLRVTEGTRAPITPLRPLERYDFKGFIFSANGFPALAGPPLCWIMSRGRQDRAFLFFSRGGCELGLCERSLVQIFDFLITMVNALTVSFFNPSQSSLSRIRLQTF